MKKNITNERSVVILVDMNEHIKFVIDSAVIYNPP